MTARLTWSEVDERWPGASVYWDRDVAGEGWDPALVERDGVLWAVQTVGHRFCPPLEPDRWPGCRCRVWEPTLKTWWTHSKWNRLVKWLNSQELVVQCDALAEPTIRDDQETIEWRVRAWLRPIGHMTRPDPVD